MDDSFHYCDIFTKTSIFIILRVAANHDAKSVKHQDKQTTLQNYNRFPKYLILHHRNMFPLRVKYDGVAETGVVNVSYIVVCQ